MAIIAVLATAILPNFKRLWPGYQRKEFVDYMNSLMQVTWHNAIVTNKLHKVIFDLEKRKMWVELQSDKQANALGEIPFLPMKSPYMKTVYQWGAETFEFKNFYIAKRDEISLTLRGKGGKIWFFVTPEGLAQPVILNIYDLKNAPSGQRGTEFSLVLNPFLVQFKLYDAFQKPE
jgi:hypothetical protein